MNEQHVEWQDVDDTISECEHLVPLTVKPEPAPEKPQKMIPKNTRKTNSVQTSFGNPQRFVNIMYNDQISAQGMQSLQAHPLSEPQANSSLLLKNKISMLQQQKQQEEHFMMEEQVVLKDWA